MKNYKSYLRAFWIFLAIGVSTGAIVSCEEKKGPATKVGDKIDDALDKRPGEKIRDAVEDIKK